MRSDTIGGQAYFDVIVFFVTVLSYAFIFLKKKGYAFILQLHMALFLHLPLPLSDATSATFLGQTKYILQDGERTIHRDFI